MISMPLSCGASTRATPTRAAARFQRPRVARALARSRGRARHALSDPADPAFSPSRSIDEGLPIGRNIWIEKGVLKNLAYTRFWAQKQDKPPNRARGSRREAWRLSGGNEERREELIAGCERGILVTHFFYIRSLEPRTVLQTGLTRDGTFLIEKGKITKSLKNFRWNESPLLMLNRLEDIGRPEPVAVGRLMPALRISRFDFTSLSEAV